MRPIVYYLNSKKPQDLRVIAEHWDANIQGSLVSGNAYELSREMNSEFLQRRLLEKLDKNELDLILFITEQPDFTTDSATITEYLQVKNIASVKTLARLRSVGLVFDDKVINKPTEEEVKTAVQQVARYNRASVPELYKPIIVMPRELAQPLRRLVLEFKAATGQPGDAPAVKLSKLPLAQLLERLEPYVLEEKANELGIYLTEKESTPSRLAREIALNLTTKATQDRIIRDLPTKDSRELFAKIKKKGATTIEQLLEEYVSLRRLGRNLRPLTDNLLVWEVWEGNNQAVVFVPSEISSPSAEAPAAASQALQTITEPGSATSYPPYAMAWDILTFLSYIQQNEVELTNDGYVPKRHLKKITAKFWYDDLSASATDELERTSFVLRLAEALQLYKTNFENQTRLTPGPKFEEWLQLDLYEQSRRIYALWLVEPTRFNYFYYLNYYVNRDVAIQAYKIMQSWLLECQPGVWYSFDALLVKVRRENPFFVRSRKELVNMVGAYRFEEMQRNWPKIEGELIRSTFSNVFEWLGILRIGRDEKGLPVGFSLTDFGAELIDYPNAVKQVVPTTDKPLLVQPNFEIMLFVPQTEALWKLQSIAEQKKLDTVSLYNLTKTSVMAGLEGGMSQREIIDWLEAHNPQPLPQNLKISIADWSKGFKRAVVERAVLLETDDETTLDELIKSKTYAEYFVRRLSPTVALLNLPTTAPQGRSDPLKSLRTKLRNSGFASR